MQIDALTTASFAFLEAVFFAKKNYTEAHSLTVY